jgi:F-type H+-transporting ATPase subunit epsilon
MARTIQVRVVTNEGQALADEAVSVIAPGELGYLGMLYNHAPLVTTLKPGKLTWRRPDGHRQTLLVGAGLMEIARNQLTLLTTSVIEPPMESEAH